MIMMQKNEPKKEGPEKCEKSQNLTKKSLLLNCLH